MKYIVALSILMLPLSPCLAQCLVDLNGNLVESDGSPCATALPFLQVPPDARFGALANTGIALSPDANSLHFNASNLAFTNKRLGISANLMPWQWSNHIFLASVSAYLTLNNKAGKKLQDSRMQTLAIGSRGFSLGQIQYTDEQGNPLKLFRPHEFDITLAYARKLGKRFSVALAARYIYSNLFNGTSVTTQMRPASAFAADLSFTYRQPIKIGKETSSLNFGLALNNLGSKASYTISAHRNYIPANLGLGTAFEYRIHKRHMLAIAFDINKLMVPTSIAPLLENGAQNPDYDTNLDGIADYKQHAVPASWFISFADAPAGIKEELQEFRLSWGIEYWYNKLIAVRTGYYYENKHKGGKQFLTVGLGVRYQFFNFNISYVIPSFGAQHNPLDNILRFSLLFEFAQVGKEKAQPLIEG